MNTKLIYTFYFLSGFSALIYEVVWLRKLELVFGTTTYAVSTVIAVFFSGLALGSFLFGRLADSKGNIASLLNCYIAKKNQFNNETMKQSNNSLLLYGLLEVGIGCYALLTPWIFTGIEQAQALVWQEFSPSYGGFSVVTFVLSTLGLIIPTILMGGTFPVIAKAIHANKMRMGIARMDANERTGSSVGLLYGLNTLGAVLGTLLAGFWLIATIGVNQTIWVAAFISLIVGGVAVFYANRMRMKIVRMYPNKNISIHSQNSN